MKKDEYFDIRNLAWEVLIEIKADKLPIKIAPMCKVMGAKAVSYKAGQERLEKIGLWHLTAKTDGFTVRQEKGYVIFYDESKSECRQRFTICHELGHIALRHLAIGQVTLRNQEPQRHDDANEKDANMFAARILAPACVLHFAGITSAEDIAKHCNISLPAAEFRAERLAVLCKRNKFLTSDLERKIFTYFNVYIEATRQGSFQAEHQGHQSLLET